MSILDAYPRRSKGKKCWQLAVPLFAGNWRHFDIFEQRCCRNCPILVMGYFSCLPCRRVVDEHGGLFVRVWDRNVIIAKARRSSEGGFWLRIFAVILWLGIIPLVGLWLHHKSQ